MYPSVRLLGAFLCCVVHVHCTAVDSDGDNGVLFRKVKDMSRQIKEQSRQIHDWNERLDTELDFAKEDLRSELKRHIKERVGEALVEILNSESLEELIRSQVLSEVRRLRLSQHQLRRRMQQLSKSFSDVVLEQETLTKAQDKATDFITYFKYMVDSRCTKDAPEVPVDSLIPVEMKLRQATEKISVLKNELEMLNNSCEIRDDNTTAHPIVTTTPAPPQRKPEPERNRLIVAPYSNTPTPFHQLNIHSNTLGKYSAQTLIYISAVAYVPATHVLLISTHRPDTILSSPLDSNGRTVLTEGVSSYGMAVDDERGLVFLTTFSPKKTISCMTTTGRDFTTISNLKYSNPRSITVDPILQRVYAAVHTHLITMRYNGSDLQELATGTNMHAVTLDMRGDLYFNIGKTLMKMEMSGENHVTSNITLLPAVGLPWNSVYYKNSVYFSGIGSIWRIDVLHDVTVMALQTLPGRGLLSMCIVP